MSELVECQHCGRRVVSEVVKKVGRLIVCPRCVDIAQRDLEAERRQKEIEAGEAAKKRELEARLREDRARKAATPPPPRTPAALSGKRGKSGALSFIAAQASPPPLPGAPQTATQLPRQLCCPKCGSDEIRKVSVIYEAGTSGISMTGQASTLGFAFDEGAIVPAFGASSGTAKGTQQTLLAQKLQPPPKPTQTNYGVAAVLGTVALSFFVLAPCASMGIGICAIIFLVTGVSP